MQTEHSLFVSLHKWVRQQDENFCTEGLIYILRLMLREFPDHAGNAIGWLTNGLIEHDCVEGRVTITGQVSEDEGRPDIVISAGNKTAWIEVKVDSIVGPTQLERYRSMLDRKAGEKRLILLSREEENLPDGNRPDCNRRWVDLGGRLESVFRTLNDRPSRLSFVLEDYLAFMRSKQMMLNRVSRSAAQSLMDVGSILIQLKQACLLAKYSPTSRKSDSWMGYDMYDGNVFVGWIGFNWNEPQWLLYSVDKQSEFDPETVREIGGSGVTIHEKYWSNSIDLVNCEEYLGADADGQVRYLHKHLVETSVRALRTTLKKPGPCSSEPPTRGSAAG